MSPGNPIALLLEDEPLISMDIEVTLRTAGYSVVTVMSCHAAGEWLDAHTPDVVVVDIRLQDGSCADVAARLIAARVPFVVHSGELPSDHRDGPFGHGTWIGKPAQPKVLAYAVTAAHRRCMASA